jgi:two-component system invasion response regulator UvrY
MNPIPRIALIDNQDWYRSTMLDELKKQVPKAVVLELSDGAFLFGAFQKWTLTEYPNIIFFDVNMPGIDAVKVVIWLKDRFPKMKVIILGRVDKDGLIFQILKIGVSGYVRKSMTIAEFSAALDGILTHGEFYADRMDLAILAVKETDARLSDYDRKFIELCCSEMKYWEIAKKTGRSEKKINEDRKAIFKKLDVKTRVGLVKVAVKNGFQGESG